MANYGDRVNKTLHAQVDTFWELLQIAQYLAPGTWPLQVLTQIEGPEKYQRRFMAVVSNGDDNVSGTAKTPGGAVALLISKLLDGAVFPLTGDYGGAYVKPDFDDTPEGKMYKALREAVADKELDREAFYGRVRAIVRGEYPPRDED